MYRTAIKPHAVVVLAPGSIIRPEDIPPEIRAPGPPSMRLLPASARVTVATVTRPLYRSDATAACGR